MESGSVVQWYKTEVLFWRSCGAVFWSAVCLLPVMLLYVLCSALSLWRPWMALPAGLESVMSLSFLLWFLLMTTVLVLMAATASVSVVAQVSSTRLQSYLSLVQWSRLPHLCVCFMGGACVALTACHFAPTRFHALTSLLTTGDRAVLVLNEAHLFLVLSGGVTGLIHYCNYYLNHHNHLAFPALQRDKYFRVRSELLPLCGLCLRLMWTHIRIFYLGYWALGGFYRRWVMEVLNIHTLKEEQGLDSVIGLLDAGLLRQTLLTSLLILLPWNLLTVMQRVYHTQRLEIPLLASTTFSATSPHSLTQALLSANCPLLQHLAFLDLCYLSGHSAERRQQVYSLSQPGGHPLTWRAVCSACLNHLTDLTARVEAAHRAAMATLPVQQLPPRKIFSSDPSFPCAAAYQYCNFGGGEEEGSVCGEDGSTTTLNSDQSRSTLSQPSQHQLPSYPGFETLPAPTVNRPRINNTLAAKVYRALEDQPGLSYFLREVPDARCTQLFANCQLHMWAIQALSQLGAASYEEDKYGVVQQTLGAVFTSLLHLQTALEKYFKLQPLGVRGGRDPPAPFSLVSQQLRVTLKTALYRLTSKFSKHLCDLHLSADCMRRVRPFLDYRE